MLYARAALGVGLLFVSALRPAPSLAGQIAIAAADADGLIAAADRAGAGDVIELAAGTYRPSRAIWFGKIGTAAAPIVLRPAAGARVILDGGALPKDASMLGIGGQHVVIRGLEIQNVPKNGVSVWGGSHVDVVENTIHDCGLGGIFVGSSATDVRIEGNRVFHTSLENKPRTATGGWSPAIGSQRAERVTVIGNTVFENYGEGIIFNLTKSSVASKNVVYDNFACGLYLDNAVDCRFEDNLVYSTGNTEFFRNLSGWVPAGGIQMANESYGTEKLPLRGNRVTGNVVLGGGWGFYYGSYQAGGGMVDTVIAHNTFYGAAVELLHVDDDAHTNTTFANNLFVQTDGKPMVRVGGSAGMKFVGNGWHGGHAGSAAGEGDVTGDPRFVSAGGRSAADYDLAAGSPYLGRATKISGISDGGSIGARGAASTTDGASGGAAVPPATPASPATPAPSEPEGTQPDSQPGLLGTYFADESFSAVAFTRSDATVDFDWAGGSPSDALAADGFSVRWTGTLTAPTSEVVTFGTTSDDGVRLWIGDQLVVDNWTLHAPTDNSGTVSLEAGRAYAVKLEYHEHGGGAVARLWWERPARAREVVPKDVLSHATAGAALATYELAGGADDARRSSPVRSGMGCDLSRRGGSSLPALVLGALALATGWARRRLRLLPIRPVAKRAR